MVLEFAPTWQPSQLCVPMLMWLDGGATMGFRILALKVAAFAALWHCAQLVLVD
jgi:hypothetical protein